MRVYAVRKDGETVFTIAVVIGAEATETRRAGEDTIFRNAGLAGLRHWP